GRILQGDAFHFKQDLARLYYCNPMVRSAFAFPHTSFSRLLGDRLVREQSDLNLATALHETRHGNTGRFNLTIGDPTRFENFQTEIAESQLAAAPGLSAHTTALLLAVLNFLWH